MRTLKKYAVYTAMIGCYDTIQQLLCTDDRFDYYLFSDSYAADTECGMWKVKNIEYANDNPILIARYIKTHATTLLPEYEAVLWIDANIQILDHYLYDKVVEYNQKGVYVASTRHPETDDIYEHTYMMTYINVEHDYISLKCCHHLFSRGFPQHFGLFDTCVFYRQINNHVHDFENRWWKCVESISHRDQFSCTYALWESNIPINFILPSNEYIKPPMVSTSGLILTKHVRFFCHEHVSMRKYVKLERLEKIRLKCRLQKDMNDPLFIKQWKKMGKSSIGNLLLYIWGVLYGIKYSPILINEFIKRHIKKYYPYNQ